MKKSHKDITLFIKMMFFLIDTLTISPMTHLSITMMTQGYMLRRKSQIQNHKTFRNLLLVILLKNQLY